ncbi:DUF2235 domain-containing protein [Actinobacillus equuli subsp. haemolyticus]|uniref:DUF2235 domain-containing protein n=1 Tax=Actinobacillus equuli TaxID=718 RepID=UPI0024424023|nr:DUF2235 domain-containing protein [Actinobacillus equuli]WGE78117.1 DUF2235 domain-containing protein [Actinobacillus equuli subsp. haemolyticus]
MTCKVLRVGLFFDGTGNNLTNDEKLNQTSNIARLYRLYPKLAEKDAYIIGNKVTECRIYLDSIYIEGVGTKDNASDSKIDKGTVSGGAKRINRAIKEIRALRAKFPKDEYKLYIDVLGFSRGASLARDFINLLNKFENNKPLGHKFKFVGLFDTVGSFGNAGDDKNYKPIDENQDSEGWALWSEIFGTPSAEKYEPYNLNLSRQSAKKIVHFVALDEYRKNFPLTDIEGAGETYRFIGAHSDVGGGYLPSTTESIFEYINKKTLTEAKQALSNPENGIPIGEGWNAEYRMVEQNYSLSSKRGVRYAYAYGRRVVTNDLQRVTLMAMYNCAVKAGVPLLPFTEDLSQSHLASLVKEIAYTEYTPFFNVISSSSECVQPLLVGNFSQVLKNYLIEVLERPLSVEHFIQHQTDTLRKTDKLPKQPKHFRGKLHLSILARYAHNSACTRDADGLKLAPIGFKHRTPDFGEVIANAPLYSQFGAIDVFPIRMVFENNINDAIVLDESA